MRDVVRVLRADRGAALAHLGASSIATVRVWRTRRIVAPAAERGGTRRDADSKPSKRLRAQISSRGNDRFVLGLNPHRRFRASREGDPFGTVSAIALGILALGASQVVQYVTGFGVVRRASRSAGMLANEGEACAEPPAPPWTRAVARSPCAAASSAARAGTGGDGARARFGEAPRSS